MTHYTFTDGKGSYYTAEADNIEQAYNEAKVELSKVDNDFKLRLRLLAKQPSE